MFFASFRLEVANERLWRGGEEIRLRPKAYNVLLYLVEHSGSLVTKNALMDAVWPELHVTDAVLKEYVREIRKALGDHAQKPQFIETVHRRGYRFLLPTLSNPKPGVDSAVHGMSVSSQEFVGRKEEIRFLRDRVEGVFRGNGSMVFITGAAGIGKTRLARELHSYIQERGCYWLEGKYDRGGTHPFSAWTDILKTYLHQTDARALQRLPSAHKAQLAKLVPGVAVRRNRSTVAPSQPHTDPGSERMRLFDALLQFFVLLSREAPLVLFVDDLQWADSITLLAHIARALGNHRILVLAAYREDELKENTHLWRTVLDMNRERLFHPVLLTPLVESEVAQFVAGLLKGPASQELVAHVYQKAEGNPFFVEEVLHLLTQQKAIARKEAVYEIREGVFGTPESVKAVVQERLERLGSAAEKLLRIASVIGREFPWQLLGQVSTEDENVLIEVMDRCEAAGIIRSQAVLGSYVFTHDLMQEGLYESIGPARRRRYHLQIGKTIERIHAKRTSKPYDALAHHFLAANDLEKALDYSIKAGEKAKQASSWEGAHRHFLKALEISETLPEQVARKIYTLEHLMELEALLGRPSLRHVERALELYGEIGDRRNVARMHRRIGVAWLTGIEGQIKGAELTVHREAAVKLLERDHDSAEKAETHSHNSFGLFLVLDLDSAVKHGRRAVAIAKHLKNPDEICRACTTLMAPLALRGDLAEARKYVDIFWKESFNTKDPLVKAQALLYPFSAYPTNDREWLECWVRRCLEYCRRFRITRYDLTLYGFSALLSALIERPQEGLEALRIAENSALRRPSFTPHMLRFAGATHAIFGDWERADYLLSRALKAAESGQLPFYIVETCTFYGRFLLACGDIAKAEDIILEGYTQAYQKGSVLQELHLLPLLSELQVRTGRLERAEENLKRARKLLRRPQPWRGLEGPVHLAEGLLSTAKSRWPRAEKAFTAARETEKKYGFTYNEARVLFAWSEMYVKRHRKRDRERARELLGQAKDIFLRCAAKKDIEKVEVALKSSS